MNDFGDYPNPQGLPRFIPPHTTTTLELDTHCVDCEGLDPIKLESWNVPQDHCRAFGALMPDGTLLDLGEKEPIAMQRARAMAGELQKGKRLPSEAWDGGLDSVVCAE